MLRHAFDHNYNVKQEEDDKRVPDDTKYHSKEARLVVALVQMCIVEERPVHSTNVFGSDGEDVGTGDWLLDFFKVDFYAFVTVEVDTHRSVPLIIVTVVAALVLHVVPLLLVVPIQVVGSRGECAENSIALSLACELQRHTVTPPIARLESVTTDVEVEPVTICRKDLVVRRGVLGQFVEVGLALVWEGQDALLEQVHFILLNPVGALSALDAALSREQVIWLLL